MRLLLAAACSTLIAAPATPVTEAVSDAALSVVTVAGVDALASEPGPDVELGASCTSPAGYRVDYPQDWSVNTEETLPPCSWFHPEPFTVPEASDVRTAAITLSVQQDVDLSAVWPDEVTRTTVDVDGREAIRVEQVTSAGLYPVGTRITSYAVDLSASGNPGAALVADTVELPGFDYACNVEVLDAMMASLDLDGTDRL